MLIKDLGRYITGYTGAIHIGGHEGEECEWYHNMRFDNVLWFEPNPVSFKILKENIKEYNNQVAINLGVHDTLKEAVLNIANNGESSSLLSFGTHKKHHPNIKFVGQIKVRLIRMDSFNLDGYNFLNVDVQGVELNVIKSFGGLINNFKYIYAEVNQEALYKGGSLIGEIDDYLQAFGFKRTLTKMTKANWGDALYVKN